MRCRILLLVGIVLIGLGACASAVPTPTPMDISLVDPQALPTSAITDPQLREGQANYDRYCAHCHGYLGEGQIGDSAAGTRELGLRIVPAHNADGPAWMYADQVLLEVVQQGIVNPLNNFPMPGFGDVLTEDQIMAIYAYIKTWWTDEQRVYQAQVTANLAKAWEGLDLSGAPFPTTTPEGQ